MKTASTPRIVYLGNRCLGLSCLRMLFNAGATPVALCVPSGDSAEAVEDMKTLVPGIPTFEGKETFSGAADALRALQPDYLLSIHFPLIIPKDILAIPTIGTLNLHPAYLPFNRGWHTPSWAILEGTPFGATLHWVDSGVDSGPIALQKRVDVLSTDTADSLYQRALQAEEELFREALPLLLSNTLPKIPQEGAGTMHKRAELEGMRKLDLDRMGAEEVLRRVRALSTNKLEENAYIEDNDERVPMRIMPSTQRS